MVLTYPFILIVGWPRFWFHILVASDFFSSHQVMLGAGPVASSWWVAWVPGFWCALHGSKLGSGEGFVSKTACWIYQRPNVGDGVACQHRYSSAMSPKSRKQKGNSFLLNSHCTPMSRICLLQRSPRFFDNATYVRVDGCVPIWGRLGRVLCSTSMVAVAHQGHVVTYNWFHGKAGNPFYPSRQEQGHTPLPYICVFWFSLTAIVASEDRAIVYDWFQRDTCNF